MWVLNGKMKKNQKKLELYVDIVDCFAYKHSYQARGYKSAAVEIVND
jgi:hypothetical protein